MKICITGWYFHEPFLTAIAASGYETLIVGHRERPTFGLKLVLTPEGRGLEFGCFQQYLMEHWDGVSDVLFMQDDGEITGSALDDIAALSEKQEIDQAFVFRDEYEEYFNQGHSGRAIWCRGSWLTWLKASGGFDVDWENLGVTEGKRANYGVGMLALKVDRNPRTSWIAIVPGLQMARRGWISDKCYQYKRTEGHHGIVTPPGLT